MSNVKQFIKDYGAMLTVILAIIGFAYYLGKLETVVGVIEKNTDNLITQIKTQSDEIKDFKRYIQYIVYPTLKKIDNSIPELHAKIDTQRNIMEEQVSLTLALSKKKGSIKRFLYSSATEETSTTQGWGMVPTPMGIQRAAAVTPRKETIDLARSLLLQERAMRSKAPTIETKTVAAAPEKTGRDIEKALNLVGLSTETKKSDQYKEIKKVQQTPNFFIAIRDLIIGLLHPEKYEADVARLPKTK